MKKALTLFVALIMAVVVSAQNTTAKMPDASTATIDWTVGTSVQYSYQGSSNVGVSAFATIGNDWKLRISGCIPGLVPVKGFDRYGSVLIGGSYNFTDWLYALIEVGASVNPSIPTKVGFTAGGGVGFQFDFGKRSRISTELGTEVAENNLKWLITPYCKVGYSIRLKL